MNYARVSRKSQRLVEFIEMVAQTAHLGGHCKIISDTKCALYDTSHWDDLRSAVVRQRFPNCAISVTTSSSSVSGFVVIFELHDSTTRIRDSFILALVICTMATIGFYLFSLVYDAIPLAPPSIIHTVSNMNKMLTKKTA